MIVGSGTLAVFGTWFLNYFFVDKKKRGAEIITTNRVLWMQKLRDNISEVIKCVATFNEKISFLNDTDEKMLLEMEKFRLAKAQIFLLLNYDGCKDDEIKRILETMEVTLTAVRINLLLFKMGNEPNEDIIRKQRLVLVPGIEYLTFISSIYLKCEWERTKKFAKFGEGFEFNFEREFDGYYSKRKELLDELKNAFYVKHK
ncbi:MAG: hypothetical protein FWE13_00145 [Firmicutes bacterium]|nr:hypothetical protein [Bacillota bacterium]